MICADHFSTIQNTSKDHHALIWPAQRLLIAYRLLGGDWRVMATLEGCGRARIAPFDAIELDLEAVLGGR
jgi:hypothetical protein